MADFASRRSKRRSCSRNPNDSLVVNSADKENVSNTDVDDAGVSMKKRRVSDESVQTEADLQVAVQSNLSSHDNSCSTTKTERLDDEIDELDPKECQVREPFEDDADVDEDDKAIHEDTDGAGADQKEEEAPAIDANASTVSTVRAARGKKEKNGSGEAGIIKEIYVENFMCHRKLKVSLNRNVNFIHGQNGSGKSAILAAIQICLGANARRTHRARNLKDLVRKDATSNAPTSAKVRVTLVNNENDGYKFDTYGDTITVERVISLTGGFNGYRMLDHDGKEQSRLKKDLDDMLDTLNIQVENPVAVLDQEEAKKFLMGKAEDKYNFFMKATELERVDRSYASILDTVQEMNDSTNRTKEGLRQKMDQVDHLKKMYEQHLEADKLEDKLQQMSVKYAWSYYHSVASDYDKCVESMAVFKEKAATKQEELTQAEQSLGSPEVEANEKREQMDQLLEEAKKQSELKRELEKQLQEAQNPFKAKERQLESLNREQSRAEKQLKAAKQRLQSARDQMLRQTGEAQSDSLRRASMLNEAEEQLSTAKAKVNDLKQAVSSAFRSYEELEPHVQDAKNKTQSFLNQLRGVESTIKEFESSSGVSLAMWGRNVAKVQKLVEHAKKSGKFSGPVLGPIGSYLLVGPGKEEYASVAELALGNGNLDRYIVTNSNDRRIFQEVRKQAGCLSDCGCFQVREGKRYDIPQAPNVEGIETVASVFEIANDLVFNCLVDNAGIDQKVIARDKKLSENCLLETNGQDYSIRDRNVIAVYCLPQGDQWTVKNGSLAMFSNEKRLRTTIGVDTSAALEAAKEEESHLHEELRQLRSEENRLDHEHSKHQKTWHVAKKSMQQNEARIQDLLTQIEDIKTEMETSANATIDTREYEEEVCEAEEVLQSLKNDESTLKIELDDARPKIEELKSRFDECTLRNHKVLQDIENSERDLTQLLDSKSQQEEMLQKKREKIRKYQEIMKKYEDKVSESLDEKESALRKARLLTFRLQQREKISQEQYSSIAPEEDISSDPTEDDLDVIKPFLNEHEPQYYEVRMAKLRKRIDAERQKKKLSKEDASVAYEKYVRAKDDVAAKTKQVAEVEDHIKELMNDLKERKKRWKQFRNHLTMATGMKFSEMLSINHYAGDLSFSHEDRTLDLAVQKNSTQSQGVSKDVKSLSGGERSYTTMCLLVALGETLETPFRILDEFDVFLDTEARKLTIKALIHVAKRMDHRQFIFITPQDLSSIQPDPKLKILKLTPPQRYHNAGGPTQQTLEFSQPT